MRIKNKELMIGKYIPYNFDVYKNKKRLFLFGLRAFRENASEHLLSFENEHFVEIPSFEETKDLIINYAFRSRLNKEKTGTNLNLIINNSGYKLFTRFNFYNVLDYFINKNPDEVSEEFKTQFKNTRGYQNYMMPDSEKGYFIYQGKYCVYKKEDYERVLRNMKNKLNKSETIFILENKCLNYMPGLDWAMNFFHFSDYKHGQHVGKEETVSIENKLVA